MKQLAHNNLKSLDVETNLACCDKALVARFWGKVNRHPNCWLWTGARQNSGYGRFGLNKTNGHKIVWAHRFAWILANGLPSEPGLTVDHLCRNQSCVNPDHLEMVTAAENLRRGAKRAPKTHCLRGHEFNKANTYISLKRKYKTCRVCRRDSRRLKRRAAKSSPRASS